MFRLVLTLLCLSATILLPAQKPIDDSSEESKDVLRDSDDIRLFYSQRYTKHKFPQTGSGSVFGLTLDVSRDRVEEQIRKQQQDTKVQPLNIELVFHILHTEDERLAKQAVQSQLEALNRDFNNKSITSRHPNDPEGEYTRLAASTQITFSAAQSEATRIGSGISTLRKTERPWESWDKMKDVRLGGSPGIEQSRYLNIWVCDFSGDIGSYSSSIYCIDKADGIVIDARYFGVSKEEDTNYRQGKTLTHLIGNYLGLQDLYNEFDYCADDYVEDTPIHNSPNNKIYPHRHRSTCPDNPVEMTMNFMDSSPDETQTMFTQGQVLRMHTVLRTTRSNLISSNTNSKL